MSVPKTVKSLLSAQPLLFDFLRQGLANITAVAGQLQEAVEKELGRDVEIAAIGMAIRRVLEEETKFELSDWQFPPDLEISSKSNIYEVAIKRSSKSTKAIELVRQAVDTSSGGFLSIVEGTYEIVFFTNQSNKSLVKKIISRNKITSELDNLAYVTVNWEKLTKDIPGIYYRITHCLAMKGISIQSFHTVGAEMILFFKSDVFAQAHQELLGLLKQ